MKKDIIIIILVSILIGLAVSWFFPVETAKFLKAFNYVQTEKYVFTYEIPKDANVKEFWIFGWDDNGTVSLPQLGKPHGIATTNGSYLPDGWRHDGTRVFKE